MKFLTLTLIIALSANVAWAKGKKSRSSNKTINMSQQFDGLAGNEAIIEKAQALQPTNTMRIVQKREVDRSWRLELSPTFGMVDSGDSYVATSSWGAGLDLHITPRWSIGARYSNYRNEFTKEGRELFDKAAATQANGNNPNFTRPDVDFPDQSVLAVVSWYPIYGKVSWFESAVSQFDFYFLAGAGTMKTSKISSPMYTGGAGVGVWWNSWFTSRAEVRYQSYKDFVYTGERSIDGFIGQIGIGFML